MDELRLDELLRSLGSSEPQDAWEQFLEAYAPLILQIVRLNERGEDAISDCFLAVCEGLAYNRFRRLRKFNSAGPARFSTWLRVVVRNLSVDWRRKEFGRRGRFEFVRRLSALDQAIFQCLHVDRLSQDQVFHRLVPKFPELSRPILAERVDHILELLSPRQQWLLSSRGGGQGENVREFLDELADQRPSPECTAISEQLRARLRRAVRHLSHGDRLLLQLRFEQELTLEQVARLLRLGDAQRADRRIREVLTHLRETLDETERGAAEKLDIRP